MIRRLLAIACLSLLAAPLLGQHGRSHSSSSVDSPSKTVYVSGYTRADGTYVAPYYRRPAGTASGSAGGSGGGAAVGEDHADLSAWAAKHRSRTPTATLKPSPSAKRSEEPSTVSTEAGSGNYIAWSRPRGTPTPGPVAKRASR